MGTGTLAPATIWSDKCQCLELDPQSGFSPSILSQPWTRPRGQAVPSYVAEGVQVVVCQLQLLEGDQLPHPVGPRRWRIRVDVEPSWHGGLSLPRHHPANRAIGHSRGLAQSPRLLSESKSSET